MSGRAGGKDKAGGEGKTDPPEPGAAREPFTLGEVPEPASELPAEMPLLTPPAPDSDKAFHNFRFLESGQGRPLRLLAEYLEPLARLDRWRVRDTIVFFGSSRIVSPAVAEAELTRARRQGRGIEAAETRAALSRYYDSTRRLAARLATWAAELPGEGRRFAIASGGGPGIMEAANRGASEAGAANIGFNISLPSGEQRNDFTTPELAFRFHYFFMRKFWFVYLAHAFVFMPGGFGTLDELFEVLTLVQTGKVRKRIPLVLFGSSYWDSVLDLESLVRWGTISAEDAELLTVTDSEDVAFETITAALGRHGLADPGVHL